MASAPGLCSEAHLWGYTGESLSHSHRQRKVRVSASVCSLHAQATPCTLLIHTHVYILIKMSLLGVWEEEFLQIP